MISKGTKYWDFNALLGGNEGEMSIPVDQINIYPLFREDYLYSREDVRNEQNLLEKVGITTRIVVERTADGYSLIGPLLPFQALTEVGYANIPCIVRSGDLPQVQQVLSIRLNAEYSSLSPLVYARLISRLERLFPVMKAVSGMNLGIKREWIANILGISSSAVLRYSYISKVPQSLQLRCADPNFPYLCYKEAVNFNDSQFQELLEELIHYELHSRYIQISAGELTEMIRRIGNGHEGVDDIPENPIKSAFDAPSLAQSDRNHDAHTMPALRDPMVERFYQNLQDSYADRYDEDVDEGSKSELFRVAHNDGYFVPDETLQEAAYLLYSLSNTRLAGGQRLLDYACLRSILDSVNQLYDTMVP